jgi:hypothetical protein
VSGRFISKNTLTLYLYRKRGKKEGLTPTFCFPSTKKRAPKLKIEIRFGFLPFLLKKNDSLRRNSEVATETVKLAKYTEKISRNDNSIPAHAPRIFAVLFFVFCGWSFFCFWGVFTAKKRGKRAVFILLPPTGYVFPLVPHFLCFF